MNKHMTRTETAYVKRFLKKENQFRGEPTAVEKATPFILTVLGIFLIVYTVVLFSGKPTDYELKWVLMPGALSGLVLILSGLLCSILIRRRNEKRRLAGILRKPLF